MAIPTVKETPEDGEYWWPVELCHFCKQATRYWHENTNNPVCPDCAKSHRVAELPDYGKKIRAEKRRNRLREGGDQ